MIRSYNQYVRKKDLVQNITEKIRYYETYSNKLVNKIERNQDLYIEGYADSLKVNNKLVKARIKCHSKISKLSEKRSKLLAEIYQYEKSSR